MEVKVFCPCGAKYKFDVEPVNGRLPGPVFCPKCNAEGTAAANAILAQSQAAHPVAQPAPPAMAPLAPQGSGAAPVPVVRVSAIPSAARPAVKLSVQSHVPSAATSESATPQLSHPAAAPIVQPKSGERRQRGYGEANVPMGLAGAIVSGLVGAFVWFLFIKMTGIRLGYLAWGVGIITGFGTRLFAGAGHHRLGLIAGGCAFLAIILGQIAAFQSEVTKYLAEAATESYTSQIAYAKQAIEAKSDDELKRLVAEHDESEGKVETADVSAVTPQRLADFRAKELPKLRDLTNGKPSKRDFEAKTIQTIREGIPYWVILGNSLSLFTILWVILGVGSAFKFATSE